MFKETQNSHKELYLCNGMKNLSRAFATSSLEFIKVTSNWGGSSSFAAYVISWYSLLRLRWGWSPLSGSLLFVFVFHNFCFPGGIPPRLDLPLVLCSTLKESDQIEIIYGDSLKVQVEWPQSPQRSESWDHLTTAKEGNGHKILRRMAEI